MKGVSFQIMPSLVVPVVLLFLLQGCVYAQSSLVTSDLAMSDLPDSAHPSPQIPSAASASDRPQAVAYKLSHDQWQHRVVLVFAPSAQSPAYRQQMQAWQTDTAGVGDRDLKLVEVLAAGESRVNGQPLTAAASEQLRQQFGVAAADFAVVLVGKDGKEKQRSQTPIDLAALFGTIDAMPMRQQEMGDRP